MKRSEKPAPFSLAARAAHAGAPVRVGVIVGVDAGRPSVDFAGNSHGPLAARALLALEPAALAEAAARRREVVLLFEGGDERSPIIAGFLQPEPAAPMLAAVLEATLSGPRVQAEVDGKRQVIEAQEEIVLRCGQASITLRRDGKVLIRGLHVETHAAGTNRVKGATVKIN